MAAVEVAVADVDVVAVVLVAAVAVEIVMNIIAVVAAVATVMIVAMEVDAVVIGDVPILIVVTQILRGVTNVIYAKVQNLTELEVVVDQVVVVVVVVAIEADAEVVDLGNDSIIHIYNKRKEVNKFSNRSCLLFSSKGMTGVEEVAIEVDEVVDSVVEIEEVAVDEVVEVQCAEVAGKFKKTETK